MNDDSLNLSAREQTIDDVLRGKNQIKVPDYQREYSWGEEQWDDLWEDALALLRSRDSHFLGSTVVINQPGQSPPQLELVDGQQRFTTVSIILAIIRERFSESSDYQQQSELIRECLEVRGNDGQPHPRLVLSEYNNSEYQAIVSPNEELPDDGQLRDAYDYFSNKVSNLGLEKTDSVREELITSMTLVLIECESEVSAFRLFESLNNKGLDLTPVDLIKNRLFMVANESEDIDVNYIKSQWEDIMSTIRPELAQNHRFFTHYLMASPTPEIRDNISKSTLYKDFKRVLEEELSTTGLTVEDWISDMNDKSDLYVDIVNCSVSGYRKSKSQDIRGHLTNIQIKNRRIRTVLLRMVQEYEDADELVEGLAILEVYSFRSKITGKRGGNRSRDRFWSRLCSVVFDKPNPNRRLRRFLSERMPSDEQFRTALLQTNFSNNDLTKYMLDRLEQQQFMRNGRGKGIQDRSVVDIEHIAPRAAFSAKKYTPWKRYLDCGQDEFDQYVDRLGNLTLLENRMNIQASDRPFEQKKRAYESTDFEMTRNLREFDEWGIEQIQERGEELADAAVEIWRMDNV